ncbi:DegT/DnrJ/EryC1/StrS aminotransferase family protein, partial [Candidatus Electrothrix marina]
GRGKALSAMEGGVIVTDRNDLGGILSDLLKKIEVPSVLDRLKLAVKTILTTVLQHPVLFCLPKALPFLKLGETLYEEDFSIRQMSSFQKSLVGNWQKRLKGHQKTRKKNIIFWRENFPQIITQICAGQKKASLIRLPLLARSAEERDKVCLKSEAVGCGIMPTYPAPINEISQISEEFAGQYFPNAQQMAKCLMTIPVHEYVSERDRRRILKLIKT